MEKQGYFAPEGVVNRRSVAGAVRPGGPRMTGTTARRDAPLSALALFAHPDDIEFVAAGTLLLLAEAGWLIHYANIANGDCGSLVTDRAETARIRDGEARAAAAILGAEFHAPVSSDLMIFYDERHLRRVAAIVRAARPTIVLTHFPVDYMEDHTNACRLAVTGAFVKGMPNFATDPPLDPVPGDVFVYHAMPHGQCDPLRRPMSPEFIVDTTTVHARKRAALAAHASQKAWLDATQGMDSYLDTCDEVSRRVGERWGTGGHAEGWTRHLHLGFSADDADPLAEALAPFVRTVAR